MVRGEESNIASNSSSPVLYIEEISSFTEYADVEKEHRRSSATWSKATKVTKSAVRGSGKGRRQIGLKELKPTSSLVLKALVLSIRSVGRSGHEPHVVQDRNGEGLHQANAVDPEGPGIIW